MLSKGKLFKISFSSFVKVVGHHSGIRISPLLLTIVAIALAKTIAGSFKTPPQFPEWCPPSLKLTSKSKFIAPRVPIKIVGTPGCNLGPSDAIKTSEARSARLFLKNSLNPGDPISSDVSITNLTLNPSDFRIDKTASSAMMFIRCWDLLSAVPRPNNFSPLAFRMNGSKPSCHCSC